MTLIDSGYDRWLTHPIDVAYGSSDRITVLAEHVDVTDADYIDWRDEWAADNPPADGDTADVDQRWQDSPDFERYLEWAEEQQRDADLDYWAEARSGL
ncbi:hypothetical protein [Desertimonas flava]|uniref:hypothetical protein n=1 Tax=Desertimonas flava TaxID=2064846 RepID=UPI000E343FCE|nr:hypothetical protein [Desertimonas flava]